jgi:NarL family two-component system response regulator LiaR
MDINLPKVNGYEASRAILTTWPAARILVLTNQDDAHVLKKFLDLGVKGFLLKDVQLEYLTECIHRIMAGDTIELSNELAEKMQNSKILSKDDVAVTLTEREREVLMALAKGHSNQQLADMLVVSPKTVHNHLYNIYSKIGVKTRAEAIVWAIESGFLEK